MSKDLKVTASNKNKNDAKFKFQGQYARSHLWFDLDFDCIELSFSTHEPDLYKETFSYTWHDKIQINLKYF